MYHHSAINGERLGVVRLGQHPTDMVWRARKAGGEPGRAGTMGRAPVRCRGEHEQRVCRRRIGKQRHEDDRVDQRRDDGRVSRGNDAERSRHEHRSNRSCSWFAPMRTPSRGRHLGREQCRSWVRADWLVSDGCAIAARTADWSSSTDEACEVRRIRTVRIPPCVPRPLHLGGRDRAICRPAANRDRIRDRSVR